MNLFRMKFLPILIVFMYILNTTNATDQLRDKFFPNNNDKDNHDDEHWWENKFYSNDINNDNIQRNKINNANNFQRKQLECLKKLLILYRKILVDVNDKFRSLNHHDLILKLTLNSNELQEYSNYVDELETIYEDVFIDDHDKDDNTNDSTTKNEFKNEKFCHKLSAIEPKFNKLLRRTTIEKSSTFLSSIQNFFHSIFKWKNLIFNRQTLINYSTMITIILIQLVLLIYTRIRSLKNCIGLIIINIILIGSLMKFYWRKQLEYEPKHFDDEYNPDLIELFIDYMTSLFNTSFIGFLETIHPKLNDLFFQNRNFFNSLNPMAWLKDFILLLLSVLILYHLFVPLFSAIIPLIFKIFFSNSSSDNDNDDEYNHPRRAYHRSQVVIDDRNGQSPAMQQQPQQTIVHQTFNFHNNMIGNMNDIPSTIMLHVARNGKINNLNAIEDNDEYYSANEDD